MREPWMAGIDDFHSESLSNRAWRLAKNAVDIVDDIYGTDAHKQQGELVAALVTAMSDFAVNDLSYKRQLDREENK